MRPNRVLPRWAFAGTTGLVITSGHIWVVTASPDRHYNGIFFGVLVMAPAGFYALGRRSRTTPIVSGSLPLIVTAGAWLIVVVSKNDFRAIVPILAWPATIAISFWPSQATRLS